jgi:hypothetical protein
MEMEVFGSQAFTAVIYFTSSRIQSGGQFPDKFEYVRAQDIMSELILKML